MTVNANSQFQVIDGFGGFQGGNYLGGDFSHDIVDLPEPNRTQVMDSLFSDWNGIGLSILRMRIPPEMELSLNSWNYTDHGKCYLSDGLTTTGTTCDTFAPCPVGQSCQNTQVWVMKQAAKRGPVKLFSSPWSPPTWMKNNAAFSGGSLLPAHYQHYADFLSHYAKEYAAANGLSIYAISVQNEPDTPGGSACNANPWDTSAWTDATIAQFLSQYLAPTFLTNGVTAKVMAPEAAKWDNVEATRPENPLATTCPPGLQAAPLMQATYNTPAALARVDIVAGHTYNQSNVSLPFSSALAAGKRVWQTETSQLEHGFIPYGANLWDVDGSLQWVRQIHDGIVNASLSAWLFFGLYGGTQGDNGSGAIITPQGAGTGIALSYFYYMFGQYSKFIRPGFKRIATSGTGNPLLNVSAYQDPATKQTVIVVINQGNVNRVVSFANQGWSYPGAVTTYTTSNYTLSVLLTGLTRQSKVSLANVFIPAYGVVTLVSSTPADILWRNTTTGVPSLWLMNSLTTPTTINLAAASSDWQVQATGDFDGDGTSDLLWRSTSTGQPVIGFMNRGSVAVNGAITTPATVWQVQGTGDFDGDGKSDIFWRNFSTGQNAVWLMDGVNVKGYATLPGAIGNDWLFRGTGDFDGDGKSDVLWHNTNGQPVIWFMNGAAVIGSGVWLSHVPSTAWQVKGVGDSNHDGKADILWYNSSTSAVSTWLMNGYTITSEPTAGFITGDWAIQGVGDYNVDGTSDVVFRNTNGSVRIWTMANGILGTQQNVSTVLGSDWQINATGNFDQ